MKNLAEYFIRSVKSHPNHTAVVIDNVNFSYLTISNKSGQLAAYLKKIKLDRCAVLSDQGLDAYLGLLACFMAGKTYIPLSIKSPCERNLQILKFSDAKMLIIDKKCIEAAVNLLKQCGQVLDVLIPGVDELPSEFQGLNHRFHFSKTIFEQSVIDKLVTNDQAYLLFTSGSTGSPKAIMNSHISSIDYIRKMSDYYQPTDSDRFSQMTDFTFDVVIHELFLCWANGACLYTITDRQFAILPRFIQQYQLTFFISVPSVVSLLKQWKRLTSPSFPSIRFTSFLGEPLTEDLARAWHLAAPNSMIDNLYGPTEATIIFSIYRWNPDKTHPSGYVPIGSPLQGQTMSIFDACSKPLPAGMVGEIYLSGSQVAKKYFNNPITSKERFIDGYYKTGDFGYWDNDYGFIYKGRDGDLIKIRGSRVERLEIEMILSQIARTSMVAVVPFQASEDRLVMGIIAYIGESEIPNAIILKLCREKLPDYMIPAKLIRVQTLPQNKNGKIDYSLLKSGAYLVE